MMTNLKEVNFGMNQFCGPAVLSAMTGKTTDECASVIMSITGRAEVRAVNIEHLIKAFERLRFDCVKVNSPSGSLFGTLNYLSSSDGMYVVMIPHHVVAVEVQSGKIYLVDNHSKQPLPAEGSARLSQRVQQVYKVTAKAEPKFIRTDIRVEKRYCNVYIEALDVYEPATDSIHRRLGQFTFRDENELNMIMEKLR